MDPNCTLERLGQLLDSQLELTMLILYQQFDVNEYFTNLMKEKVIMLKKGIKRGSAESEHVTIKKNEIVVKDHTVDMGLI